MNRSGGWLGNASMAAQRIGGRPDLSIYGILIALPFLGWLPLLLSVVPPVRASDLAFLGAGFFSSSLFPWNVVLLAVIATFLMLAATFLAALGEAGLLGANADPPGARSPVRAAEVAFSVLTAAALPAIAVIAALVSAAAAVSPDEFGLPDLGVPLWLRIVSHLVPLVVAFAAVTIAGQAVGAAALRRAIGPHCQSIGASLRDGVGDVIRHPARLIGLAVVSTVADLVAIGLATAILRVLWAPIGPELASGSLVNPRAVVLLVGFVAIWLATVMALGALRAWVSIWWSLELGREIPEPRREVQEAHL
jgi:hypothetical protein